LDYAVADVRVNGRSVGEGEFNAIVAGGLGVPVVLVTGDDVVVEQIRNLVGDVEGVVVKQALSRTSALAVSPDVSNARIKEAAERALRRAADFQPVRFTEPYRVEFIYKPPWDDRIERILQANPEISHPSPRVLTRTCQNVDELIDFYMKALDIGLESPPVLRPKN